MLEARGLRKAYGDRLLIDELSFKLPKNGLVGVIGPNGAGKTTLFRMITGLEKPDAGELRVGDSVKLAYVDQSRDALEGEKTVFQEVSGGLDSARPRRAPGAVTGLPRRLRLQGRRPAEAGEGPLRWRAQPGSPGQDAEERGNLLLLDEPSNDLTWRRSAHWRRGS